LAKYNQPGIDVATMRLHAANGILKQAGIDKKFDALATPSCCVGRITPNQACNSMAVIPANAHCCPGKIIRPWREALQGLVCRGKTPSANS
jgi:hypothetical protein